MTLGRSLAATALATLLIGGAVFVLTRKPASAPTSDALKLNASLYDAISTGSSQSFTEVRVASFVRSLPPNNAILAAPPNTVSVVFSAVLGPSSSIIVTNADNQPVSLGRASISDDRLSMTVLLTSNVAGPLTVEYHACSLENTCATGRFGFSVRPSGT